MGNILKPVCVCKKDFEEIFLGTGMRILGGKNRDIVPSQCNHCKTIVETNLYNKRYRCLKCKRKVEPYVKIRKVEVEDYFKDYGMDYEFDYELEDKKYKCPNCNEVELKFEWVGLWD